MRQLFGRLCAFAGAQRGSAAVEFALIVPIMIAVYIGSVEASTLIIIDRKVQSVAGSVGDLVARTDERLATDDLKDYFRAASGIMTPYAADGVTQKVTAIKVNNDGTNSVLWQSSYQGGVYSTVAKLALPKTFTLPAEMTAIAKNQTVIAAEASYTYTPMFGFVLQQSVNLYRSNFFMPRFEGGIALVP